MREIRVRNTRFALMQGDITKVPADAIVNAANSGLRGGGGVDGAIHRAGGPSIMEECRRIGGCPTGEARITTAGRLPARYVIHAVGPIWRGGSRGEPALLASAYRLALQLAEQHAVRSIAFPSLSTGAYGYPVQEAAYVALRTMLDQLRSGTSLESVTMVLFTADHLRIHEGVLDQLLAGEVP